MNKTYVVSVVLLLLLAGAGAYLLRRPNTKMVETDSALTEKVSEDVMVDDAMMDETLVAEADSKVDEKMMQKNGSYAPFTSKVLVSSSETRRVLFFYANWCPTCLPADASFSERESEIPANVTLIRVNYNDTETEQAEKDLAQKYGVTYQHTFVQIDSQGAEVAKWNGGQIEELVSKVQ